MHDRGHREARILDRLVRTRTRLFGRSWSLFHVCGWIGLALFIMQGVLLTAYLGLSFGALAAIILTAAVTFLALPMIHKILFGAERLTSFHHKAAVLAAAALVLRLLGQPVLAHLDLLILGVGLFTACGRVGCLMVGCCHGRPCRWGVCYRQEHAEAGFTPYFVGVRLFPVQLAESLWIFAIVIAGNLLILRGDVQGETLAWYVIAYCGGRFCLEFLRGDPTRPFYAGFPRAQWTCLVVMASAAGTEAYGILPYHLWHWAAAAVVGAVMAAIAAGRRSSKTNRCHLLHPHHIREVAALLERVAQPEIDTGPVAAQKGALSVVEVGCSSLGIRLSAGTIKDADKRIDHYALSADGATMREADARTLADLILLLRHHTGPWELVAGGRKVFHLLLRRPVSY